MIGFILELEKRSLHRHHETRHEVGDEEDFSSVSHRHDFGDPSLECARTLEALQSSSTNEELLRFDSSWDEFWLLLRKCGCDARGMQEKTFRHCVRGGGIDANFPKLPRYLLGDVLRIHR